VVKAALNIAYTGEIGVDPTPLPGTQYRVNFIEAGSPAAT
jgi:hypothetical protein